MTEPVLEHLSAAAAEPIEDADPEVLRAVIDTCADMVDRAATALRSWGPT